MERLLYSRGRADSCPKANSPPHPLLPGLTIGGKSLYRQREGLLEETAQTLGVILQSVIRGLPGSSSLFEAQRNLQAQVGLFPFPEASSQSCGSCSLSSCC